MLRLFRFFRRRDCERRGLFCYHDGQRLRYGDPWLLYRRLMDHPARVLDLTAAVDRSREPETSQYIDAVAEVFSLVRWDESTGRGLTDLEIVAFPGSLYAHLERIKKNGEESSSSSPPTESKSSEPQEPRESAQVSGSPPDTPASASKPSVV